MIFVAKVPGPRYERYSELAFVDTPINNPDFDMFAEDSAASSHLSGSLNENMESGRKDSADYLSDYGMGILSVVDPNYVPPHNSNNNNISMMNWSLCSANLNQVDSGNRLFPLPALSSNYGTKNGRSGSPDNKNVGHQNKGCRVFVDSNYGYPSQHLSYSNGSPVPATGGHYCDTDFEGLTGANRKNLSPANIRSPNLRRFNSVDQAYANSDADFESSRSRPPPRPDTLATSMAMPRNDVLQSENTQAADHLYSTINW